MAITLGGNPGLLSGRVEAALARGECASLDSCVAGVVHPPADRPGATHRLAASIFSALFFRFPHHPHLAAWAEQARDGLELLRQPARLVLARRLLRYDVFFGRPARAALLLDRLRVGRNTGRRAPGVQVQWGLFEAMHHDALGAHAECLEAVGRARSIAARHAVQSWSGALRALEANALLGLGDLQGLRGVWETARNSAARMGLLATAYLYQLGTQIALAEGDPPLAAERAEVAMRVATCAGAPLFQALAWLSAAEVQLDCGMPETAGVLLRQAQEVARSSGSAQLAILCALMRGYALLRFPGTGDAGSELRLGFGLAHRHGYRNFSWWSPRMMTALCIGALERGMQVAYIQDLAKLRRLAPPAPPVHVESWPWPVKVYTLRRFALLVNGRPSQVRRKAQHKPLELFKALIAQGGRDVGEESLTAALWPDAEGDAARRAFDTTLHRLRRLLGNRQALILRDRKLSLDPCICWVDSWAFERLLSEAEATLADPAADPAGDVLVRLAQRVQGLYHGPFLGKEFDAAWAVSLRERLRSRYLRHLVSIGARWQQLQRWELAVECYRKGLEVDDLAEQLYQNLMLCHLRLGQRGEALSVYRQCRFILSVVLGITPAPATEALYQQLRRGR
ncbi:MAG: bacterial transcriptional activator domain-containing protein [Gammaproteobacteria bacterium]|nr:bacterial transcriptional activator domain-containing protein [Gammaproteobacteria bacterium]